MTKGKELCPVGFNRHHGRLGAYMSYDSKFRGLAWSGRIPA